VACCAPNKSTRAVSFYHISRLANISHCARGKKIRLYTKTRRLKNGLLNFIKKQKEAAEKQPKIQIDEPRDKIRKDSADECCAAGDFG
jgi:hypothetical protein